MRKHNIKNKFKENVGNLLGQLIVLCFVAYIEFQDLPDYLLLPLMASCKLAAVFNMQMTMHLVSRITNSLHIYISAPALCCQYLVTVMVGMTIWWWYLSSPLYYCLYVVIACNCSNIMES
ncbi:hypothetical protein Pint_15861 [Pistacia integerrima]|uniref:Uncharacterized protein n=1 Tax=Pistacia integerrima TaxID=434235 RepID=A0ACC0ZB69_9ROSI|nr:hypothetical protein Pint_15861 [Pistacia integerrima]